MKNILSHQSSLLLLIILFFACVQLDAKDVYTVKHFNTINGLKSDRTVRVLQDKRGYYWFGTLKGIQRFDGYEFKEFPIESADFDIPGDFEVHKLFLTSDSTLLVGTSVGLLEFDEFKNQFNYIPFPIENNEYRVTDICTINDSTYFLNSHTRKGVFVYKRNTKIVEHAESANDSLMKHPKVRQVLKGPDSTYFFHISYDLYQYDLNKDTFQKCDRGENPPNYFFHYGVTDNNGVFWLLSSTGLYYLESGGSLKRVTDIDSYCSLNNQIGSAIIAATDSSLYVAFDWWGVVEISTNTKKVISVIQKTKHRLPELNSNQIYSLYLSDNGDLWWCSDGAYLLTKDTSGKQFLKSGEYPETNNYAVLDILEDSHGTIWVGTDGGGLHTYSITDNTTTPVFQTENKNLSEAKVIMSLLEDSIKHNLWVGTYGDGLYCYNYIDNNIKHYSYLSYKGKSISSDKIWDVELDNNQNILVSSLCRSVDIFDQKSKEWKQLSAEDKKLRDNCVTTLEKDKDGRILFGYTEEGLDWYDSESFSMANSVLHTKDRIFSIFPDGDTIWLGCFNSLKAYVKSEKAFIQPKVAEMFDGIRLFDVFKDSQLRYWIATENGLYYFRRQDSVPTISVLDSYFKSNIAKCVYETKEGFLLIGGINGLLSVPVDKAENYIDADFKIYITDFRLFGETYSLVNNTGDAILPNEIDIIKLPYDKNYVSLSFSTMDISGIDNVCYAVRVENFYNSWQKIDRDENKIDLPNLQPGTYHITIKAMLKGNESIYNTRVITVEIAPPFWKTWWFKVILISFLVVVIFIRIRQITKKNILLTRLVDERTKELQLSNKKLEDQYEEVQESKMVIEMKNEELSETLLTKDKLLGVLGHDFKNPLGALVGLSSLLVKNISTIKQEKVIEFVEQIHSVSKTLSDQMVSVFDWARGQMDTLDYKPVDINIESLLSDAVQLSHIAAQQKNISITVQTDFLYNAHVDVRMISTVFRNILSNAIKFTPTGGSILLMIQESDDIIEVSFADSGVGMEQEKVNSLLGVFNPDFVSYGTNNEKGSGLGLQVCKVFVAKNNGHLKIQSEPKIGSVFSVLLPKANSIAQKKKLLISTKKKSIDDKTVTSLDYTVLLIEDNVEILGILEETFGKYYNILKASDGNTGLHITKNMFPDIIVSDVNMPKMSGLEMCKAIRADKQTQHIPIILITAENSENIELQSYELGATDFVSKPFDTSVLLKKVEAFLRSRKHYKEKIERELDRGAFNLPVSVDDELIDEILAIIKERFTDSEFDVTDIADEVGMSRTQLWRRMKSAFGKTPSELIKEMRLNKAVEMLKSGKFRISEIAYHVGFTDQRYFSRVFQKEFGKTPSEYMNEISS